MIIPVGHERDGVRRLPWVSFTIIGLCFLAFLVTMQSEGDGYVAEDALEEVLYYYFEHPYLEVNEDVHRLFEERGVFQMAELVEEANEGYYVKPEDPAALAEEQATMDRLCEQAAGALDEHPFFSWGLIPARPHVLAFLTHMFLHAGWLHLIGNLFILYLAGPFIEDVWGRPLFAGFYVACGLLAALGFMVRAGDSAIPMIGASGAIAGVMGAFLVRYGQTQIRFLYVFGFFIRGTFDAPAWFMLPLWFAIQVFYGLLFDMTGVGGGIAYWAHVAGFIAGAGIAYAIRHFDVEKRFIEDKIEAKTQTVVVDNSAVDSALALEQDGNVDGAIEALKQEIASNPRPDDAALALWAVAVRHERPAEATEPMVALVERELRRGDDELAVTHWEEILRHIPHPKAGADLLVRISQALQRHGYAHSAVMALRRAMLEAGSGMTSALAQRIARAAQHLDPQIARGSLQLVLNRPDLDPAERAALEQLMPQ